MDDHDDTTDLIRETLDRTGRVATERIVIARRDDVVELRGAVSTAEEATLAATVASRYAETVSNRLAVDRNLREDATDPRRVPDVVVVEQDQSIEAPAASVEDAAVQATGEQEPSLPGLGQAELAGSARRATDDDDDDQEAADG